MKEENWPEQLQAKNETVDRNSLRKGQQIKTSRDYGTNDGRTHINILAQLDQFKLRDELKTCGEFPRYCPARINGIHVFAFMDSGNCLPNVISEEFAKRLGFEREQLKLVPKLQSVGTAKATSELTVLGTTPRALKLRLGGSQRRISFRPLVIEGLAMDVNLSGPFMRRARIDQLHSEGVLSVEGVKVPLLTRKQCDQGLVATLGQSTRPSVDRSIAYIAKTVHIPPKSACYVPLRVSALDQLQMPAESGTVEVDPSFLGKSQLLPLQLTITTPDENGNIWTSVWNNTNKEQVLNEDIKFGEFNNSKDNYVLAMFNDPTGEKEVQSEMEDPTDPEVINRKRVEAKIRLEKLDQKGRIETSKEFQLDQSPSLQKDDKLKNEVIELLVEFDDIMGRGDRIGRTTLVEHDIDTGDLRPIRMKARPLNPVQEEDLKEQLKQWLKQGIIKEGTSEWRFPMVPALKKHTTKLRWACDLRYVNSASKVDSFPLPDMSDNLARLANSKVFSALDCSGAFLNVPLTKRAQDRCCFGTPLGTYVFLFMPFGLTNAPATFSRLMQKVFEGIPSSEALVFLDDALAHSSCPRKHLGILRKIFERYRYAGLTLQPRKTHLFRDEVDYLGYHVSQKGLSVVPEYVKVVQEWPVPTTAKEIQIFLGKAGYYRRFIKNYSEFAGPLSEYLKVANEKENFHEKIELSAQALKCFEKLKHDLCQAPILAFPDFLSKEPFILDTDFSGKSIGAVLSQVQDGAEKVIAYGAKKLLPREANYSSNKGELLAVVYFIEKFKYFLSHRKFILRTDHQALTWLTTMKCPTGMYSRWQELLAHYDFQVRFRKGEHHTNADCLSRIAHAPGGDEETCPPVNSIQLLPSDKITAKELARLQENDPELHDVICWVKTGQQPSAEAEKHLGPIQRTYCKAFSLLKLTPAGVLIMADPRSNSERICLPEVAQERVIRLAHEMGHQGIGSTFHQIRHRFFFWNMSRKIELVIRCCLACQKKVGKPKDQRYSHQDVQVGYPGQKWAIDLVGPLEEAPGGHRHILTAKDVFTRWMEAIPIVDTSAETIAKELEKEVFSRHGLPEQIHSDNAHNISGTVIQEICKQLGIAKSVTPDYNPKSNPVERLHRDLGTSLKAVMEETNHDWVSCIPAVLLALRTTRCKQTGFTPFFLTYGREACLPVDVAMGNEPARKLGPVQYANEVYQRMQAAFSSARQQQHAMIDKQKSYYTQDPPLDNLAEGKLVWLYTPRARKGESKKLHSSWTGPWRVLSQVSDVLRRIKTEGDWNRKVLEVVVSIDRLKEYFQQSGTSQRVIQEDLTWEDVAVDDEEIDNSELRSSREQGVVVQPHIHVQVPTLPAEVVDLRPSTAAPPNVQAGSQAQDQESTDVSAGNEETATPMEAEDSPPESSTNPESSSTDADPEASSTEISLETDRENPDTGDGQEPEEMPMVPTLPPKKKPLISRSVIHPVKRSRTPDFSTDSTSSPEEVSPEDANLRRSVRIQIKKLKEKARKQAQKLVEDVSTSTTPDLPRSQYQVTKKPRKKKSKNTTSSQIDSRSKLNAIDYAFVVPVIQLLQNDGYI